MTTDTQGWDSRFEPSDDGSANGAPSGSDALWHRDVHQQQQLLQQVLTAVRNELPFIQSPDLKFISRIGQGSTFEVNKELFSPRFAGASDPYFVAVKRITSVNLSRDGLNTTNTTHESPEQRNSRLRSLASISREVRVLTHPKLRSHGCLASALGWGWTNHAWTESRQPYLVMEYSNKGSLSLFAQQRALTLSDRRLLALDVAMGLRALHDCGIVHGDVKPENVLVYDYMRTRDQDNRNHIAKLADFGCAMFKQDFAAREEYYLGTPKYNAPEISGITRGIVTERGLASSPERDLDKFQQFMTADCYSFGLVLWETANKGKSFVDPAWLKPGENALDFLVREFQTGKQNTILERAVEFFSHLQEWHAAEEQETGSVRDNDKNRVVNLTRDELAARLKPYPHLSRQLDNQEESHISDMKILEAFQTTVSICLQQEPWKRANIHEIVRTLSEDNGDKAPEGGVSASRWGPSVDISIINTIGYDRSEWLFEPGAQVSPLIKGLRIADMMRELHPPKPKGLLKLGGVPRNAPAMPFHQLIKAPTEVRVETIIVTPQAAHYEFEDMFKSALRTHWQPPWDDQVAAAELMLSAVKAEQDPGKRAQAHLQLAIMYHIGYGVFPDSLETLSHLEVGSKDNLVARAIFPQVHAALSLDNVSKEGGHHAFPLHNSIPTYRKPAIFYDSLLWRVESQEGQGDTSSADSIITIGDISVASLEILAVLLKRNRFDPNIVAQALIAACRDCQLEEALLLAKYSTDFSAINTKLPNPLHWLIMFSPNDAVKLFQVLLAGPPSISAHSTTTTAANEERLPAIRALLSSEHEQVTILLPHRCLELCGTPLHWATTAGYTPLISAYLSLHPNLLNIRNKSHMSLNNGVHQSHIPSFSSLDLAVGHHHPDIVRLLLDRGAETFGGDYHREHSVFHMLGYETFPFARYVAHGGRHRAALKEVIRILVEKGLDINVLDSRDQTPLYAAVKNIDLEGYILDEMIAAGAEPGIECENEDGNLVCSAIICCGQRRHSSLKIPLLLPLVSADRINMRRKYGKSNLNALHLCALLGADRAAEVLIERMGVGSGGIDLDLVTQKGVTALGLAAMQGSLAVLELLIKKGASLSRGRPLEAAISCRQMGAITILLGAGARVAPPVETESGYGEGICLMTTDDDISWRTGILEAAISIDWNRPSFVRRLLVKFPHLFRDLEVLHYRPEDGKVNSDTKKEPRRTWTLLHRAAYFGDVEAVEALLGAGVDPTMECSLSGTPLQLAISLREAREIKTRQAPSYHPREKGELPKEVLVWNPHDTRGIARSKMRFRVCLDEIIRVLGRAEREWGLNRPS